MSYWAKHMLTALGKMPCGSLLFRRTSVRWGEADLHCSVEQRHPQCCCLLISWFVFEDFIPFISEFSSNPYAAVTISTASFLFFIFLIWQGFSSCIFHILTSFLIKVTEIHSAVLHQTWPWARDTGTPRWKVALSSDSLFLHQRGVTCTSEEAHWVVSLW